MNKKFDHFTKTNMKDKLESPETKLTYLVLPYINEDMEDFGRELSQLVKSFFKNIELRVVFKAPFEIKNFFNFKDKTSKLMRSKVVYKINCENCECFYVGKTSRQLNVRLDEHKKGVGQGNYKSALFKHQQLTGHKINYDEVEILDSADSDKKLLLKEMLLINLHKPSVNTRVKSELFHLFCKRLFSILVESGFLFLKFCLSYV